MRINVMRRIAARFAPQEGIQTQSLQQRNGRPWLVLVYPVARRYGERRSAARLGRFEPALSSGVEVIRRMIHAFYDPGFSFPKFAQRFPEHRPSLIDCLVGDVLKDMTPFKDALAQMTAPRPPLLAA